MLLRSGVDTRHWFNMIMTCCNQSVAQETMCARTAAENYWDSQPPHPTRSESIQRWLLGRPSLGRRLLLHEWCHPKKKGGKRKIIATSKKSQKSSIIMDPIAPFFLLYNTSYHDSLDQCLEVNFIINFVYCPQPPHQQEVVNHRVSLFIIFKIIITGFKIIKPIQPPKPVKIDKVSIISHLLHIS